MTTVWSSIKDSRPSAHRTRRRRQRPTVTFGGNLDFRPRFELVEDGTLLSTFLVTTIADSGPGSLRQAAQHYGLMRLRGQASGAENALGRSAETEGGTRLRSGKRTGPRLMPSA
jgi:hypothetical protein